MARHRKVFFEHYDLPYLCAHCGAEVEVDLVVHHVDGDPRNNDPANLTPMHFGCHTRHHHVGKKLSAEVKELIGAAHRGKVVSEETRLKLKLSHAGQGVGRKLTPEHCKKIGDALRGQARS